MQSLDSAPSEHESEQQESLTGVAAFIESGQNRVSGLFKQYEYHVYGVVAVVLAIAVHVFLGFAIAHDIHTYHKLYQSVALVVLMSLAWLVCIYYFVLKKYFGDKFYFDVWEPFVEKSSGLTSNPWFSVIVFGSMMLAILTFLVIDTWNDRRRLQSLGALALFILLLFITSANPARVKWRPILSGLILQFVMGLLILRWEPGQDAFKWTSDQIVIFLDYTKNGTQFVYGFLATGIDDQHPGPFTYTALPPVIYFGAIVSVLYFTGVMQFVLRRAGAAMQVVMGTTATESFNSVACIFLGQSEAPLLIKPYLEKMTESEIHAVMTSGFACIAGSLFAAYISFGACPMYLLSATLMSAPASLALSKLSMPETKKSRVKKMSDLELPKGDESSALEAISNGATSAIIIVESIVANLIVFLALLAFVDAIVGWGAGMLGYTGWTLERLLGYAFFPFAFVMGVSDKTDWQENIDETLKVAQLLGTKTFLNEFIAFQKLGQLIHCKELGNRATMMATYCLCSFANISSIGIQLGVLGGMCPQKKGVFAKCAIRALVTGASCCLMTASIAGLLVNSPFECPPQSGVWIPCNATRT